MCGRLSEGELIQAAPEKISRDWAQTMRMKLELNLIELWYYSEENKQIDAREEGLCVPLQAN